MNKMINFNEYLYSFLIGKKYRFKCDCTIPLDISGIVKDIKIISSEVYIYIERQDDKKLRRIVASHPNLMIQEL